MNGVSVGLSWVVFFNVNSCRIPLEQKYLRSKIKFTGMWNVWVLMNRIGCGIFKNCSDFNGNIQPSRIIAALNMKFKSIHQNNIIMFNKMPTLKHLYFIACYERNEHWSMHLLISTVIGSVVHSGSPTKWKSYWNNSVRVDLILIAHKFGKI